MRANTLQRPELPSASSANPDAAFLWLELAGMRWNVLAVVAPGDAEDAAAVAAAVAAAGSLADARPVRWVDARGIALEAVPALAAELGSDRERNLRVIVAVGDVTRDAAAAAVVRGADAAVLAVRLGECGVDQARRAVERCGSDKFIGSIPIGERGTP